ncbi:MAG: AAA family ATPase, partial [Lachnospiraceae bacterium]|nr:AAA family ATPase [Lachnospiraceae bacterium]
MENLSGLVSRIIFRNDENWYTVFELAVSEEEGSKEQTGFSDMVCVGSFSALNEGESVRLSGDYTDHPTYGVQFLVKEYEVSVPKKEAEIIRYLGSGAIRGIREGLARRIVKRFGEDTFRVIEEEPERLSEVKGISEKKAREIAVQFVEMYEQRQAMIFLQQYGISNLLSTKIYKRYGDELYQILSENPYRLAEDIEGVGFKTADEIAFKAGISPNSDFRLRCGILYALRDAVSDGHCYLPEELLLQKSQELLFQEEREEFTEVLRIQIRNLAMDKRLLIKEQNGEVCVYEAAFYYLEAGCAKRLRDLDIRLSSDERLIGQRIDRLERASGIRLDEKQKTAVVKAVTNGVSIITGGPGTGKTTIINMILKYYEAEEAEILLCAPTGRAAKRMTEATGYEAGTIQRLLHLTPYGAGADQAAVSTEALRNGRIASQFSHAEFSGKFCAAPYGEPHGYYYVK